DDADAAGLAELVELVGLQAREPAGWRLCLDGDRAAAVVDDVVRDARARGAGAVRLDPPGAAAREVAFDALPERAFHQAATSSRPRPLVQPACTAAAMSGDPWPLRWAASRCSRSWVQPR